MRIDAVELGGIVTVLGLVGAPPGGEPPRVRGLVA